MNKSTLTFTLTIHHDGSYEDYVERKESALSDLYDTLECIKLMRPLELIDYHCAEAVTTAAPAEPKRHWYRIIFDFNGKRCVDYVQSETAIRAMDLWSEDAHRYGCMDQARLMCIKLTPKQAARRDAL